MEFFTYFQIALTADVVQGDWSNNPNNFVGVDWVISFPSKYVYLDYVKEDECGDASGDDEVWCLLEDSRRTDIAGGLSGVWTGRDTTELCLTANNVTGYDNEEAESFQDVSVSPGTTPDLNLCAELNVVTFGSAGQTVKESVIQTSDRRQTITFTNLDTVRGWADLGLSWSTRPGAAVGGMIFTQRSTADPEFANGSITELQKRQERENWSDSD
jgi:hypothetical protein